MTTIMGIDPGLSGALSYLDRGVLKLFDMPTTGAGKKRAVNADAVAEIIENIGAAPDDNDRPDAAFLEHVHAIHGVDAGSTFRFGESFGVIRGIVAALRIPIFLIPPKLWKKALGLPADKEAARGLAIDLFPKFAALFARKLDHNRAEAALLAWYGNRMLGR
jgi:crossover junction endodeoxyribonuclease RuvC